MADESGDLLMKITMAGRPIAGEASSVVAGTGLDAGFKSGTPPNYFAVRTFRMEMALLGEREADVNLSEAAAQRRKEEQLREHLQRAREDDAGSVAAPLRSAAAYGRFLQARPGASRADSRGFAADLESFSIVKDIDLASMALFQACVNSTRLDSAVLIKRRYGGQQMLQTYFRLECQNLLITDFNWEEDEEAVTETIKFICRKATVTYAAQQMDGKAASASSPGVWSVLDVKR